jgi:hypothetical protein
VLPSLKQLTGPGWRRLEELAESGRTVYVSYSNGASDNQRGPWYAGVNALFGVRHELQYGVVDRITTDTVRLSVTTAFGGLSIGDTLEFAVGGNEHQRSFLPIAAVDAEVLAVDAANRPALVRRRIGSGALVFCAYPLEAMAAATAGVNPDQTALLYAALAAEAGVRPLVASGDRRVFVDGLVRADGTRFFWFVNSVAESVTVTPAAPPGAVLHDLASGAPVESVALPPFGVRVLRCPAGPTPN